MAKSRFDHAWMKKALLLAEEAFQENEVPVGCIVVIDREIVGSGYNQRELRSDPTAHAEILALREAAKNQRQWRLSEATVYVTLEPCPMCAGALLNARIKRLVFGAYDSKAGSCSSLYAIGRDPRLNHQYDVRGGVSKEECTSLLQEFFQKKRKLRIDANQSTE